MAIDVQYSPTDICNRALSRVENDAIVSLDEPTARAAECKLHYGAIRRRLLRGYLWNFAAARAALPADAVAPAHGFANAFTLPVDCLRVRRLIDATRDGQWTVEGRKILADLAAPLKITYTRDVTDGGQFDTEFENMFVLELALAIGPKLARSQTLMRDLETKLRDARTQAQRVDAMEHGPDALPASDWELARL